MREILFRGKRCDNGEWVQGFYVRADHHWHKNGIHKDWIICGASANGGWFALHNKYAVKDETVGQYIGKKDKNRKKIFEGDIVQAIKTGFDPPRKYRKPYQVHYNSDFPSAVDEYYSPFEHFTEKIAYEVIGNIHDNPELLKNP